MGRVFLALDPNLERNIALKVMAPPQLAESDDAEELERRFLIEARAAARLHHPGIVMVLDADTDPGTGFSYLAMELVEGHSLKDLLRESGRLPAAVGSDLGAQVARALDHAHQAGVVHRDVKPANVLVTPEGRVKVTDFGIAKVASQSMTLTGHILGSPFYMSPEQVKGEPVDGRSDLFSLGSILYQCTTGELPFPGDTLAAVTYKVVQVDPRPPRTCAPDLPPSLEGVIERALEKDPDRRYPTGAEMAEALESVGREAELEVPDASVTQPDRKVPETEREREGEDPGTGTVVVDSRALAVPAKDPGIAEAAGRGPRNRGPTARSVSQTLRPWVSLRRRSLIFAGLGLILLLLIGFFLQRAQESPDLPAGPVVEVGDPGVQVSAETAPQSDAADALEIPETIEPPPVPSATLRITYLHRLTRARLAVWIDGEPAWSRRVDRPGGFLKRLSGRRVEGSIPLPAGPHAIEVRLTGQPRNIDLREVIQGRFREGEVRWLRVGLNPVTKNLKLSWTE